ncbi:MAG: phosphoribosylglycinamide formyltransferase [Rhodospirillales bacterium]|nr:phosphoribosylglycinamide formyltransferase [Rhodospirillales bacterium]HJO72403.1 phosphoribosylglycinamide formyltransferase [Rhodospirillales bacterium]
MAKLKVGVLISGRGSNLQALIDAASADDYPAEIVTVISNVPGAVGLERAAKAGIPTNVVDHRDFQNRETFEDALNDVLSAAAVELLCLAGFMRLVTDGFAGRWRDRLVNVHPSLLPAFKGLDVHQRVIEAGVRFTGCTVHFLRPAMDEGPIIVQAVVPVQADDDASALAARVLAEEHRIYPLALRLIAEGRVRVVEERVLVSGAAALEGVLINPVPV